MLWLLSCFVILFFNLLVIAKLSLPPHRGAYPWAVLFLCAFWVYLKKNEVKEAMLSEKLFASPQFLLLGAGALAASFLLPRNVGLPFIVFELLLAYLGMFAIFFGRAAFIPGVLLGIYGFTIGFPLAVAKYAGFQYSMATVWMVVNVLKTFGFQAASRGQVISFPNVAGSEMSVFIDAACSGSASMTIFIAIFALMMLDIRLPGKSALYMLAFGLMGTTAQNVLRIVVLILAGHYYGPYGILTAHSYAGYVLFPSWYVVFAYVYLRHAKRFLRAA